jgi:hypothetical protein
MRKLRLRSAAFAIAAASLATVLAPQAAQAGTNGQHVEIYSYGCWYSRLWGTNQSGTEVDTGRFYLPYYGANRVGGYWWKYTLHVYCYDRNGVELGLIHAEVPVSQSGDWYRVYIEPGSVENGRSVAPVTDLVSADVGLTPSRV